MSTTTWHVGDYALLRIDGCVFRLRALGTRGMMDVFLCISESVAEPGTMSRVRNEIDTIIRLHKNNGLGMSLIEFLEKSFGSDIDIISRQINDPVQKM